LDVPIVPVAVPAGTPPRGTGAVGGGADRAVVPHFKTRIGEATVARILIVEDDQMIQELVAALLRDDGHDVTIASDGESGVDIAHALQPELIIADIKLPRLDGVAMIERIRADPATDGARIIAVSAGENLARDRDRLAADSVLSKPFDFDELLADVAVNLHHTS
jgi:DNA-binding response OmpR family regulator